MPDKKAVPFILSAVLLLFAVAVVAGGLIFVSKTYKHGKDTPEIASLPGTVDDIYPAAGNAQKKTETSAASETSPAASETEVAGIDVANALSERGYGNPDAPIKVIELASLTCGHCADFHQHTFPALKEKYIDTGKLYFIFRDFPLDARALAGTMAARCLPKERYSGFIDLLFKTQKHWAYDADSLNILRQNAKLAGLGDKAFDACINNMEIKQGIADWMEKAKNNWWEINSTPTLVIVKNIDDDSGKILRGAVKIETFDKAFEEFSSTDNTDKE